MLGCGGFDIIVVVLVVVLKVDKCEIYIDVDGVYIVDLRIVLNVLKFKEIFYDEMLEFVIFGVKVFYNRFVEFVKKYNIFFVVRLFFNDNEGIIVKEVNLVEKFLVFGVVCDKDIVRVVVIGVENVLGKVF